MGNEKGCFFRSLIFGLNGRVCWKEREIGGGGGKRLKELIGYSWWWEEEVFDIGVRKMDAI